MPASSSAALSAALSASFSGYTQDTRLLRLHTPLGSDRLLAECVDGDEALSSNYSFTIHALSLDAGIGLRALIGQPALLELQTVDRGAPRAFHGYLTGAEMTGANGGMARYALTLRPWTAFLAHTRDSRVFQDMSVIDILDVVFGAWQGRGRFSPRWRFDLADPLLYPKRSLSTQYQESDLAFAERLMNEEGLFYFFEHEGEPGSPDLGRHCMVIADHNGTFRPADQAQVRFTQPGAVMKEDSIDRWRRELRLQTNAVALSSWDYRSRDQRPVAASGAQDGIELPARDPAGAYAYPNRAQGRRMADRRLQALEARREVFTGAGTVRTLAPGSTFSLSGHAVHDLDGEDARTFAVTRVRHRMHNNLSAEIQADIASRLGPVSLPDAGFEQRGERPLYRNRIDAIRKAVPYRAGAAPYPRPLVQGQQTAIVVGPAGSAVHTDRDHRIKIQFHWQRGADSHSRLDHPNPDGHTGAPGDDRAGTWVRVAMPLAPSAGANWGSHALPRVGQEVLVDFLDGNIDRPVVIGALYNGSGASDAQHNRHSHGAGPATGNAPAWFPGDAGAHAHAAVFSGLKSQAMQDSQNGAGAYSQLLLDDSPGQARVALQRHARAHAGTDELNLGHLRHQADNQRLATVGSGAELKTAHALALRAGQGMLLSSDRRAGTPGAHMDAREAQAQIEASYELQASLAATAKKHNAFASDSPAIADMQRSAQTIAAGAGTAIAYAGPQLQLSSPQGIVVTTPAGAVFSAGSTASIAAGQDINDAAQGNSYRAAVAGISLFTYGKASARDKPNQETGIRLHAASGRVSSQSQGGETRLTADKSITVASSAKSVRAAGKQHVLLTAQGAVLRLEGGDIMVHAPGKVEFKAGMKELAGPADGSAGAPVLPKAQDIYNEAFVVLHEETKAPMAYVRYRLESASGASFEGVTDSLGRTQRVFTPRSEALKLYLPKDE